MQKRKGISLIVLVITIIVMVILAGAIVLSLNNSGIMAKAEDAVEQTNLATIREVAQMAWASAYSPNITEEDLQQAVNDALAENKVDISKYRVEVTISGVTVALRGDEPIEEAVPEEWKENIVTIIDKVPIPKGFVASSANGENRKASGLVIYEGSAPVTNDNVEDAKRTRNQYVWVPVEDFKSQFIRQNFGDSYLISNLPDCGDNEYWEVTLDIATNMPLDVQDPYVVTSTTIAEVQAMYASVKEYKGFYIARYEAGLDEQRTSIIAPVIKTGVYSIMGKIPYNYIYWNETDHAGADMLEDENGVVAVARSLYPSSNNEFGVVSTLTYGVQWDRTLAWWLETGATDGKGNRINSVIDSLDYGNYANHTIEYSDLNDNAKYAVYNESNGKLGSYSPVTSGIAKTSGVLWALTTGALKVGKVNNIYDMAGNICEWSMEGDAGDARIARGGGFMPSSKYDTVTSVSQRSDVGSGGARIGFRPSLYIKK